MKKLNPQKFILFASAILLMQLLSACSISDNQSVTSATADNDSGQEIKDNGYQANSISKLTIHPGCIGCGRCAIFDPEHFSFDGRVATVVSQENLDSNKLKRAINNCRVDIIELS